MEQVRQWVAQSQQIAPGQVRIAPLDPRVQVQPCSAALQLDYAFTPSRETVRVRCTSSPTWQLFLRLLPPTAAGPGAGPGANPSPGAGAAAAPASPAQATRTVVVTRRLLQRGTLLDASMLEVVERPALGLDPMAVSSLKDVERAETLRDIPAGTALRSYDIKRALMVRKGQAAMLTVSPGSGFQITVSVEALQDGYMGEQIRLKNTESGRLLSGVVSGPNTLRGLQN